jgi:hypothetical protein
MFIQGAIGPNAGLYLGSGVFGEFPSFLVRGLGRGLAHGSIENVSEPFRPWAHFIVVLNTHT